MTSDVGLHNLSDGKSNYCIQFQKMTFEFHVRIWHLLSVYEITCQMESQIITFDVRIWHLMSDDDICCQRECQIVTFVVKLRHFFVKLGHLLSDEMRTVKLHVNLKSVSAPALKSLSHLLKHKYLLLWVFPVTPPRLAFNTMTNTLKQRFCFLTSCIVIVIAILETGYLWWF